jgi:hypothetical protein
MYCNMYGMASVNSVASIAVCICMEVIDLPTIFLHRYGPHCDRVRHAGEVCSTGVLRNDIVYKNVVFLHELTVGLAYISDLLWRAIVRTPRAYVPAWQCLAQA